jgi:hypothetical protein
MVEVFWEILPPDEPPRTFTIVFDGAPSSSGVTLSEGLASILEAMSGETLSAGIAREVETV